MRDRVRYVLGNDRGAGQLETIVLLAIIIIICTFLLAFVAGTVTFGTTRSFGTRQIGWFKNSNTNGIYNADWVANREST